MAIICSKAPWCMNNWGDPVSKRARQWNWDVVEASLVSHGKVVNVTSSMVMTPLIKSGTCLDMNGLSARVVFVKRTSGAWSSGAESMKAERIALRGCSVIGTVLRRAWVVGSTSKTVSLG